MGQQQGNRSNVWNASMGTIFSGQPGGNPNIRALGVPFKPGNPGGKKGRAGISAKRLRQMMREQLSSAAAVQVVDGGLDSLCPLVLAICYRRLTADAGVTDDQRALADRLLEFLFPKLAASPPAPAEKPDTSLLELVDRVQQRTAAAKAQGSKPDGGA